MVEVLGSINNLVKDYTTDVQNTYKSSTDVIVTSTGVPSHNIGAFGSGDLNGNQRYLKRIPLVPSTKSTKTATHCWSDRYCFKWCPILLI